MNPDFVLEHNQDKCDHELRTFFQIWIIIKYHQIQMLIDVNFRPLHEFDMVEGAPGHTNGTPAATWGRGL